MADQAQRALTARPAPGPHLPHLSFHCSWTVSRAVWSASSTCRTPLGFEACAMPFLPAGRVCLPPLRLSANAASSAHPGASSARRLALSQRDEPVV